MIRPSFVAVSLLMIAAGVLAPAAAQAQPLTLGAVFADATPFVKLVMAALVVATLAALVICAVKVSRRDALGGGSAFLAGLRLGGPLAGGLGAAYSGLNMAIGVANVPAEAVTLKVLAPGIAEVILLLGLGFLAGAVGALCSWAVESRIDRAVLRS